MKKVGRKPKFNERTKIYSVRLPESRYDELKRELDRVVQSQIIKICDTR
jgi:hypothetical protein